MPRDLDIFLAIDHVYIIFECEMFIKNYYQEFNKSKKSSIARSLPVENQLQKNVGSIINYL